MTFKVKTTATFNDNSLETREFGTPEDAWKAAADDYIETDAGLDPEIQEP